MSSHHVPAEMKLPGYGTGSGFDAARRLLFYAYRTRKGLAHHDVKSVYWGNSNLMKQCGGTYFAASNGYVDIITVGEK